jgi:tetratricopeptide (TPR) repeat protein/predicted small secreted protein
MKPFTKSFTRKNAIPLLLMLTIPLSSMLWTGCTTARGQGGDIPETVTANAAATPSPAANALPKTPTEILDGVPLPNTDTAIAKEVAKWRDATRKEPSKAANWVNLGDALMQRAREVVDPHDYDWAKLAYEQALQIEPKRSGAMSGMAWVTGALHQFDSSVDWANKAIAIAPKDPAPYGLLGDAQMEQGDYDAAFETYQKMLDLRPDIASYSRGAHLLYVTGDVRKALWLMNKAVKAGGPYGENTAWCRAQLAEMLWSIGAVLPAESVLKEALKTAPKNYHVLTMMGRVQESKRNTSAAIEYYEKAIAVSPQHAALVGLGDLYAATGKKELAERCYAQIETAHQHHQSHGNHDELYMARFYADHDRKLERALEIVEKRKAEQGEPKGLADADICAWVYFKNGKIAEAKKYSDMATAKSTPDAARWYHAGMIYAALGEDIQAEKLLQKALQMNAAFHPLHAKIAAAKIQKLGSKPTPKKTASR